jgi:HEAT repeat protein
MPTPELSTIEAFEEALRADAVDDEDRKWDLIVHLYNQGGQEALEVAARWSGDPEPARRRLAANVLGMLGAAPSMARADGPLRGSSLALLLTMLSVETDLDVLFAITIALGPNGDEPVPAALIGLHTHPDAKVRRGVASSLGGCPDTAALDTLITLSADEDALVRQQATFSLARLTDEDFPRLRDALAARLHDYNLDARVEAVHGLATRGDQRAMQPLLDILQIPLKPTSPELVTEALCALATTIVDPRVRPHLLAERDRHLDDPIDEWPDDLRTALAKYGEPLPR